MAATTSIRATTHARDALRRLAKREKVSASSMLERLVRRAEEDALLQDGLKALLPDVAPETYARESRDLAGAPSSDALDALPWDDE